MEDPSTFHCCHRQQIAIKVFFTAGRSATVQEEGIVNVCKAIVAGTCHIVTFYVVRCTAEQKHPITGHLGITPPPLFAIVQTAR